MRRPRLLLVDNVDSFTFMLADSLRQAGAEVEVVRNNALDPAKDFSRGVDGVVTSPGPGAPEDAGVSCEVARICVDRAIPLLGICFGHQALALACGSAVERVAPMHGKVARLGHDGSGLFGHLPQGLAVTRYHSLAVPSPRPPLVANAWSEDGLVMGIRHCESPAHGFQFHPESIATEQGIALLGAFVSICRQT
ncbi:aminodeoxychorismate/anthranilate synthase component II [Sphingomonas sp. ASV193]|uniref:anthranilate synthase component II n=1 Tax=Sphingomonas sp. ASV193 TaxID=3144405 RepID=UPI0032E85315